MLILFPGTPILPPGTLFLRHGMLILFPGTPILPPGTLDLLHGTLILPCGTFDLSRGALILLPRTFDRPRGTLLLCRGTLDLPRGTLRGHGRRTPLLRSQHLRLWMRYQLLGSRNGLSTGEPTSFCTFIATLLTKGQPCPYHPPTATKYLPCEKHCDEKQAPMSLPGCRSGGGMGDLWKGGKTLERESKQSRSVGTFKGPGMALRKALYNNNPKKE